MKICVTLDEEVIEKLQKELNRVNSNPVYRGVYKDTILDWSPDEEHEYPKGTNIYIKDENGWKPYTGIFFKEEYLLTDHGKVTPWEYEIDLKGQPAERITIYNIYYKGELKESKVVIKEV